MGFLMARQRVSGAALLVIGMAITGGTRAQEGPPAGPVKNKDLEQLQGDWRPTNDCLFFYTAALTAPNFQLELTRVEDMRVEGNKLHCGRKMGQTVTIHLGTLGGRKLIGFEGKGRTLVGVYELDGDTLKICMVAQGIPERCGRTRLGIFAQYQRVKK
jgi:uncharacterized protein (TIGR03067 family)